MNMNSLGRTLLALGLSGTITSCDYTAQKERVEVGALEAREAELDELIKKDRKETLEACRSNLSTLLEIVDSCHEIADQAHELAYPGSDVKNRNTHISQHIDPTKVEYLGVCEQNTQTALFDIQSCTSSIEHMVDFASEQ